MRQLLLLRNRVEHTLQKECFLFIKDLLKLEKDLFRCFLFVGNNYSYKENDRNHSHVCACSIKCRWMVCWLQCRLLICGEFKFVSLRYLVLVCRLCLWANFLREVYLIKNWVLFESQVLLLFLLVIAFNLLISIFFIKLYKLKVSLKTFCKKIYCFIKKWMFFSNNFLFKLKYPFEFTWILINFLFSYLDPKLLTPQPTNYWFCHTFQCIR